MIVAEITQKKIDAWLKHIYKLTLRSETTSEVDSVSGKLVIQ